MTGYTFQSDCWCTTSTNYWKTVIFPSQGSQLQRRAEQIKKTLTWEDAIWWLTVILSDFDW